MTGRVDIPSEFGPVILLWNRNGSPLVRRVLLSKPEKPADLTADTLFPEATVSRCSKTDAVTEYLLGVLKGSGKPFPLKLLDMKQCSTFQTSVLLAERKIPPGSVSTYSGLAGVLNSPGSARAVGTALARNPFPLLIPCHRAVRADGYIGGFQGGQGMKKVLLEREGLSISEAGRIISPK